MASDDRSKQPRGRGSRGDSSTPRKRTSTSGAKKRRPRSPEDSTRTRSGAGRNVRDEQRGRRATTGATRRGTKQQRPEEPRDPHAKRSAQATGSTRKRPRSADEARTETRRSSATRPTNSARKAGSTQGKAVSTQGRAGSSQAEVRRNRPATTGTKRTQRQQPRRKPAVSTKLTPEQAALQRREHEAAQLKRRRTAQIVGVAVAVLIVVVAVIFGVRYMTSQISSHTAPPNPVAEMQPVPCDSSMLSVTVNQDGDAAGYPINFGLSMVNDQGKNACYIDTGDTSMKMTITSGNELIYDSQACEAGAQNKRLLLDTGLEAKQTFYWNGKASGADCSGTLDAQPGTYIARFYNGNSELLERGHVFELEPLAAAGDEPAEPLESATPDDAPTTPGPDSRGVAPNEPAETPEPTDIGSPTVDPDAPDEPDSSSTSDPFEDEEGVDEGSDLTEP